MKKYSCWGNLQALRTISRSSTTENNKVGWSGENIFFNLPSPTNFSTKEARFPLPSGLAALITRSPTEQIMRVANIISTLFLGTKQLLLLWLFNQDPLFWLSYQYQQRAMSLSNRLAERQALLKIAQLRRSNVKRWLIVTRATTANNRGNAFIYRRTYCNR